MNARPIAEVATPQGHQGFVVRPPKPPKPEPKNA